jgi:hypothetical protein
MASERDGLMRARTLVGWIIVVAVAVALPSLALSQVARQTRTLIVNGHSGDTAIVEIEGRSYVELEALVRLANGSLRFNGNQISVTLPAGGGGAEHASATPPANPGFSKEFLRAGIEQMAVIREWRVALTNAIERGYPVTEDWVAAYRSQATQNLRLASVAASTDADRNAVRLLGSELNNMNKLNQRFLDANQSMTMVRTDALKGDPLDQKILDCGHSLAAMASSGQFVDDGSCQ